MTTTAAPRLLPGVSANTMQRVIRPIVWCASIAGAVTSFSPLLPGQHSIGGLSLLISGLLLPAATLLYLLEGHRVRQEEQAGYTTLWYSHPNVPQLDKATGAVIREAGDPYVSPADWKGGVVIQSHGPAAEVVKPTFWARLLPALPAWIWVATVGTILAVVNPIGGGMFEVVDIGSVVVTLCVVVVVMVLLSLVARRRLARVRAVAPGDFVFLFSKSDDLVKEVRPLGWARPDLNDFEQLAASANSSGLTLWQGKPTAVAAHLPWSRIVAIHYDRVRSGTKPRPDLIVTYRDPNGAIRALPLSAPNADTAPIGTMLEARWIASELDRIRSGTLTARVL